MTSYIHPNTSIPLTEALYMHMLNMVMLVQKKEDYM